MKKVLLFLSDGFEILEASSFIDVMGWNYSYGDEKTELHTVGLRREVKSSFGQTMGVNYLIDEIDVSAYDALAFPGGFENYGFYRDAYDERVMKLLRDFDKQKKLIASICVAALPLGKSGVLKNHCSTTYNLLGDKRIDELKAYDTEVLDEHIVEDEHIITSSCPATAMVVAFRLLELLTSEKNCDYVKQIMGF
ncbi:MAG: DJ-1/PfpI family protein [Hyphomicrobiales bacterium]